jgi:hypothetical protein
MQSNKGCIVLLYSHVCVYTFANNSERVRDLSWTTENVTLAQIISCIFHGFHTAISLSDKMLKPFNQLQRLVISRGSNITDECFVEFHVSCI